MSNVVDFKKETSISDYVEEYEFLKKDRQQSFVMFVLALGTMLGFGVAVLVTGFYLSQAAAKLILNFI